MNNSKIIGLVFIFTLILGASYRLAEANDGGPNTAFWVIDQKTNCVSVINPEVAGSDTFLVFDYSEKIGQAKGKPWVIIEKGKCYEFYDGSEDIYIIKIVKGDERKVFSNYNLYKPTDSVDETFCEKNDFNDYFNCDTTKQGYSIVRSYSSEDLDLDYGPTSDLSQRIHFTGIHTNDLFPTKYDLGDPVTYGSVVSQENLRRIDNSPSYTRAGDLYDSLSAELNGILKACDTRIRVEKQYRFDVVPAWGESAYLHIQNVVWRQGDGSDAVMQTFDASTGENDWPRGLTDLDVFKAVELMGCQAPYEAFIQAHKEDFVTIDRLAEEVVAKYPESLGDDVYSMIRLRNSNKKEIIPTVETPRDFTPTVETPIDFVPTVLDEPTPEAKTDMLVNSSDPWMKVYTWLPILALLGMILFLRFGKK